MFTKFDESKTVILLDVEEIGCMTWPHLYQTDTTGLTQEFHELKQFLLQQYPLETMIIKSKSWANRQFVWTISCITHMSTPDFFSDRGKIDDLVLKFMHKVTV